jgi:hypothetical protein
LGEVFFGATGPGILGLWQGRVRAGVFFGRSLFLGGGVFFETPRFAHLIARSYGRTHPSISFNTCSHTGGGRLGYVQEIFFEMGFLHERFLTELFRRT